jgi:hypothetical protein
LHLEHRRDDELLHRLNAERHIIFQLFLVLFPGLTNALELLDGVRKLK